MERKGRPVLWGAGLLVAMSLVAGCRTGDLVTREKKVTVETVFSEREHKIETCMKDLARSYLELPDSVLFVDPDSKLRIKPPSLAGSEPYHAHLAQRVGGQLIDQVFHQNRDGSIEIDLSSYADPETLVITSAACEIRQSEVPSRTLKTHPGAKPEEGIAPPYVLSYKLLPAETAQTVISLQSFRYELSTPLGTLHVLPTSFNRADQLITLVDPARKLPELLNEDPYVGIARYDTAIVPRLSVEVRDAQGKVWERTGTWHVPTGLGQIFKPGENPFVIRSDERELLSFAQPPRVDLTLPEDVPATSARIGVRFYGLEGKDPLRFVLASVYPSGRRGDFGARVQTQVVEPDTREATYSVDLAGLPPEAFPLTSSVLHRLVQPWRLTGGRYRPVEPRGRAVMASTEKTKPPKGPEHLVFARYASHYDFLLFFGDGRGEGRKSSLADSYYGGSDNPPSSNLAPPPPGVLGAPPVILLPPPAVSAGHGNQNPAGGGDDSDCGCGQKGVNCPSKQPCRGHCAPCRCQPDKNDANAIVIPLTCVMKGTGCKPKDQCECGPHTWSESDCMNFIAKMTKGAAETAWFGEHFGLKPCHVVSPVAMLRVTYWGEGFQKIYKWYVVNVTFGPCGPAKDPVGNTIKWDLNIPNPIVLGPGIGGGGNGGPPPPTRGSPTTTTGIPTIVPTTTTTHPYNHPNLGIRGGQISTTLGGAGQIGSSTLLPVDVFSPAALLTLLGILGTDSQAFQTAYWTGGNDGGFAPAGWNPDLTTTWGTPQAPAVGAGTSSIGGGSTPSPPSVPPPSPPPPPPPSSKTGLLRRR